MINLNFPAMVPSCWGIGLSSPLKQQEQLGGSEPSMLTSQLSLAKNTSLMHGYQNDLCLVDHPLCMFFILGLAMIIIMFN